VEHFKDNYFCDQAIDFLQNQADGKTPFALFLYLWAPHPPLRVPEPYASLFAPDELELPPNVGQLARGEPANRRQGIAAQLAENIPLDQWRRVWAAHLGLVRLADDAIGRVLAALHNSGREKETVTVFTVDHGDHLGQHTMYQKMEMYEQAIRVPWMIRVPDLSARRFELPVSQLDILPTLTDLLNVGWDGPPPDGLSLAASIQEGASLPERPVFCQYSGNPTVGDIRRAVITSRYKYIFDPDAPAELYDLVRDPLEMENVAGDPDYAEMLQRLHAIGREWAESHGDWVQFGEAPVTA
jgi:arylsulfatase A-like enzyme